MRQLEQRLVDARLRALSPHDDTSARAELEAACLQALDELLTRPDRAEQALSLALRLARGTLGPAEAERRLLAWADEREAEGGAERPYTRAESQLLTVARELRGQP